MPSYYKKITVEEQMLFDSEIAREYKIYKVQTKDGFGEVQGPPYYSLTKTIIKEYIEENSIELEELYYPTYSGMGQVYPQYIYKPAIEQFIKYHSLYNVTQTYKGKNNREYKFIIISNKI